MGHQMAEVVIPRMLADLVDYGRSVQVEGSTVRQVLEALTAKHPELRVHLFDENRRLREHVRCFRNDRSANLEDIVAAGDRVTVLQAVSGGRG